MTSFFALSLASLVLFSGAFLFLLKKGKHEESYSFRSYFPYEGFKFTNPKLSPVAWTLLGLSLLSSLATIAYGVTSLHSHEWNTISFVLACALLYFIFALSFLFICLVNVSFPKQHLGIYFILGAACLLKEAMVGFYFVNAYLSLSKVVELILAIFLFLLATLSLFLLVNPKLKQWDRMDKVAEADGTISFKRPKRFVLAYSEWVLYFLSIVGDIIGAVGFYLLQA